MLAFTWPWWRNKNHSGLQAKHLCVFNSLQVLFFQLFYRPLHISQAYWTSQGSLLIFPNPPLFCIYWNGKSELRHGYILKNIPLFFCFVFFLFSFLKPESDLLHCWSVGREENPRIAVEEENWEELTDSCHCRGFLHSAAARDKQVFIAGKKIYLKL